MNALGLFIALLLGGKDEVKSTRWDFKDDPVGKLPSGWASAKTGKGEGSVWKIVEARDAPGGSGKALAQTAVGPGPLFNLCVIDKTKYKNVDLSVAFNAQAGDIDQGGGPVWRYQDSDNYYVARMNPLEGNFRVYKVVAGKRMQLETSNVKAEAGKWHTLRIVHKGDHIHCYLNGKLHLHVDDDEIQNAGQIGLWTKADAQTLFANIILKD